MVTARSISVHGVAAFRATSYTHLTDELVLQVTGAYLKLVPMLTFLHKDSKLTGPRASHYGRLPWAQLEALVLSVSMLDRAAMDLCPLLVALPPTAIAKALDLFLTLELHMGEYGSLSLSGGLRKCAVSRRWHSSRRIRVERLGLHGCRATSRC